MLANVANIISSAILLCWPIWFARSKIRLPHINPISLLWAIALPVELMKLYGGPISLLDSGLFDGGYQYALLMNNVFVFMNMLSAVFFFQFAKLVKLHRYLPFQRVKLARSGLRRAAFAFFIIFAISLLMIASAEFGIANWLLNPRAGYQLYRTGQGHWYALANSALSVSFVLACLVRPSASRILLILIVYLFFGYFLGSKGVLLYIFAAALVFLWFSGWRYLGRMLLLGFPIIMLLLVFNLYLALGDLFEITSILRYFDHFKNAADYYRGYLNGTVSLFYGEVVLTSLWEYVPRFFWSDKPVVYGILHVNELFYPGSAALTFTPAFGGAVEQHADYGFLGVIIFGFFAAYPIMLGVLSYLIFRRPGLQLEHITLAAVLLILVQYAPFFGNFFPGLIYILLLTTVLTATRILCIRLKWQASVSSSF